MTTRSGTYANADFHRSLFAICYCRFHTENSSTSVGRLKQFRRLVAEAEVSGEGDASPVVASANALEAFGSALDDDLNTSQALAAVHNLVRDVNTTMAEGPITAEGRDAVMGAIEKFDSVLGIFGEYRKDMLDAEIEALIEEREEARRERDFALADEIRDRLAGEGIILEDTRDGVRWKRK